MNNNQVKQKEKTRRMIIDAAFNLLLTFLDKDINDFTVLIRRSSR